MLIDNEIGEMKHIETIKRGTIREHIRKGAPPLRKSYLDATPYKQHSNLPYLLYYTPLSVKVKCFIVLFCNILGKKSV